MKQERLKGIKSQFLCYIDECQAWLQIHPGDLDALFMLSMLNTNVVTMSYLVEIKSKEDE